MRRGYIQWVPRGQGDERFFRSRAMDLVREVRTTDLVPSAAVPLPPRDETVFLLHTAAEIEHALLVQYLYAAFSLGDTRFRPELGGNDDPRRSLVNSVRGELITIAREEMGHLVTLQNVLRLIGGPLNLEREDMPFRTQFYPFPFTLEPVTKDSLAKYVATEKPANPSLTTYPRITEIMVRAVRANEALPINRVGALYERIIDLVGSLDLVHFLPETASTYQTTAEEWGQAEDPTDPRAIIVWSFGGSKTATREKAVRALRLIAEQGEGPRGVAPEDSHFHLFYRLYERFPETNPRYGRVEWAPALPVPTHPSTSPVPYPEPGREDSRITDPLGLLWAQLFNSRYRILLADLAHGLMTDRSRDPAGRAKLIDANGGWAVPEMYNLTALSNVLTRLPRQLPNLFPDGRAAVAGAPFEMPYAIHLSDLDPARWRMQRDLICESAALIAQIRTYPVNPPDAEQTLKDLKDWDDERLTFIRTRIGTARHLPRLYFSGRFTTNVNTVNNNDFQQAIDVTRMRVDLQGKTEGELRAWLKEVVDLGQGRQAIRSGWNYFGDNGCHLVDAVVTGADLGELDTAGDPVIGAAVRLEGVMVDVDPNNVFDTQIFSDRISVTGPDGVSLSGKPTVLHSRWLNFRRNLAGGGSRGAATVFQAGLSWRDGLTVSGGNSPALGELLKAARCERGVLVTFSTYLVGAALNTSQLAAEYAAGREPENPATGLVVGYISPWEAGDLASVPPGRRLNPVPGTAESIPVGPGTARFDPDRKTLLLNLIQSIPEKDDTLEKHDFGPLLVLVEKDGEFTPIAELPFTRYNRAAYEASAGQVEVDVPDELTGEMGAGLLAVAEKVTGRVLLREEVWVVETDERGFYLQEGEERPLAFTALSQGRPPSEPVTVHLAEFIAAGPHYRPVTEAERLLTLPATTTVGHDGKGSVVVRANKPGVRFIGFSAEQPLAGPLQPLTGLYAAVRVLPKDDYSHLPEAELTFAKVYSEILQYYNLAYPAMSKVFPLNDEEAVEQQAGAILDVTDKAKWTGYRYMPRTRELSDGKRELLTRWCRKVASGLAAALPNP